MLVSVVLRGIVLTSGRDSGCRPLNVRDRASSWRAAAERLTGRRDRDTSSLRGLLKEQIKSGFRARKCWGRGEIAAKLARDSVFVDRLTKSA